LPDLEREERISDHSVDFDTVSIGRAGRAGSDPDAIAVKLESLLEDVGVFARNVITNFAAPLDCERVPVFVESYPSGYNGDRLFGYRTDDNGEVLAIDTLENVRSGDIPGGK
jgi:hypothetical protein